MRGISSGLKSGQTKIKFHWSTQRHFSARCFYAKYKLFNPVLVWLWCCPERNSKHSYWSGNSFYMFHCGGKKIIKMVEPLNHFSFSEKKSGGKKKANLLHLWTSLEIFSFRGKLQWLISSGKKGKDWFWFAVWILPLQPYGCTYQTCISPRFTLILNLVLRKCFRNAYALFSSSNDWWSPK